MSNELRTSSLTSAARARGIIVGVPKRCWCGEAIVARILKSDTNPYLRYYRCLFVVDQKLVNDNHTFKWVDEAFMNEIEALAVRTRTLEQEVLKSSAERMEVEKITIEKLQVKLEKELFKRVEEMIYEAKSDMKKLMFLVCFGCFIIVVFSKLV